MLAVLRQRNFALLWSGGLISWLGDAILLLALPYYVYSQTGSALATGAMFIAQTAPRVLLSSLAGALVDRWDRRRTMIVCDVARALLLLLLLTVHSQHDFWRIYLVAFLLAILSQFFSPARGALFPRLVHKDQLTAANALDSLTGSLNRLVAPALGGALLAALGLSSVILVDAVTFLFSASMLALLRVPPLPTITTGSGAAAAGARWVAVWRDWRAGLALVSRDRLLGIFFVAEALTMLGYGITTVLLVAFVRQTLGGSPAVYGWLFTAQGVGGLLGGVLVGRRSAHLPPARLFAGGLLVLGAGYLAMFTFPVLPLTLALGVLVGAGVTSFGIGERALLQGGVAEGFLGRVFGTLNTNQSLMMLGGMGLASAFGSSLGAVALLDVAGSCSVLAGFLALVLLPQRATGTATTLALGAIQSS